MADDCSRLWKLNDSQLVAYFNINYPQKKIVENAPPAARDALRADFLLAQKTVAAGVVPSRDKEAQRAWDIWCSFCSSINANPDVSNMVDPVTLLQAFGLRRRDERISPSGDPNRARLVEDAIRLVCQKFPSLGSKDPRLDETGKQDFCMRRMFSAWKKEDSPPYRVEPVPMIILLRAAELAAAGNSARDEAIIDCIWMAFYFLLRSGEYANASGEAKHTFRLEDVEYKIGHEHIFNVHLASVAQLLAATFISLTFTDQKNGIKGEKLSHVSNGQPFACPVHAITRRITHLNPTIDMVRTSQFLLCYRIMHQSTT